MMTRRRRPRLTKKRKPRGCTDQLHNHNHNQQRPTTHDPTHNTNTTQNAEAQQQRSRNDHNHDGPEKRTLADKEIARRRPVDDETRTHLRCNWKQQSMPPNGNTHPQEVDQTQKGSAAFWAETHRSLHREEGVQVSSVYFFFHTGYGDERVQPVCSELQKHTDRCRKTNTHILIGGDVNAQVESDDEPEVIYSKYTGTHALGGQNSRGQRLRHWAVQHHLILANTFYKTALQQSHVPLNQTMQAT